ncbi:MAG TPA: SRPBCC family protein [Thiolinea sp.]|nr:SRPBCC family protein [Thiolinea sp.]
MQLKKRVSLVVCLSLVYTLPAWAADVKRLHTEQTVQINAPADQVWAVVGKFEALHAWHPAVKSTVMRNPVTRILDLGSGALLTEELEGKSDSQMSLSYRISNMSTTETIQVNGKAVEKKVLPVNTYSSTLSVKAAGTGSQVIWTGDFYPAWLDAGPAPAGMGDQDAVNTMNGVFQAGLTNLAKTMGVAAATPTSATQTTAIPTPAPAAPVAPAQTAAAPQAPTQTAPAQTATAPQAPAQTVSATAPAATTAPAQVAITPAGAKPYEGHVKCEGGTCKIDTFLTKGFRTFGQCQVCHGIDGGGSTIAPSLLARLQQLDHTTFVDRVTNGFKGQIGVMPPWKDNPNIMNNVENLYAYLKARSDGVIPAGNLERF